MEIEKYLFETIADIAPSQGSRRRGRGEGSGAPPFFASKNNNNNMDLSIYLLKCSVVPASTKIILTVCLTSFP